MVAGVGGYSASSNWLITQLDDGKYQYVSGDEERPNALRTETLTEEEINAKLRVQNAGFLLVNGVAVAQDGYTPAAVTTPSALVSFDGAPPLPNVSGPTLPASALRDRVRWLDSTEGLSDAAVLWMSLSVMARTAMRDMKDAREMKAAAHQEKIYHKGQEIAATAAKIEADKKAAQEAFWAGMVGAALSAAGSAVGSGTGFALSFAGQMTDKAVAWYSVEKGAKSEANEKELEIKRYQLMQTMMEEQIEEKKANYEAAKEVFKQALRIVDEHFEQQTQVVNKIFQS